MNTDKSKIFILIVAALIIAVGFAVVRTILVINYYDVEEGLYQVNAPGVTATRILFGVSLVLLGVVSFFAMKKRKFKKMPESNHGVVFTSSLCGFMFISSAVLISYYFLPSLFKAVFGSGVSFGAYIKSDNGINVLLLIMLLLSVIFGLVSALYYFWCASTTTRLKKLNYKLLSLMPVLWAVFYLVYMYFNKDTVINSPERSVMQLSVIAVMIYFTSEARFHFGIASNRAYTAISLMTVTAVIFACVPRFILTAFWAMPFSTETVFGVLQLAIAVYIVFRLISVTCAKEEEE